VSTETEHPDVGVNNNLQAGKEASMGMTVKIIGYVLAAMFLVGCATGPMVDKVKPGMTQDEILKMFGPPRSKQFDEAGEAWLYKACTTPDPVTCYYLNKARFYWVIFRDGKVVALQDAGAAPNAGGKTSDGMSFLCKDAIARGDQDAIFVHCK
jgi:hypothetical protein